MVTLTIQPCATASRPPVAFSAEEKIAIAVPVRRRVAELEIGIPVMGEEERETIAPSPDGLNSSFMVWGMRTRLARGGTVHVNMVNLSIPVSDLQIRHKLKRDREWVLRAIRRFVPRPWIWGWR